MACDRVKPTQLFFLELYSGHFFVLLLHVSVVFVMIYSIFSVLISKLFYYCTFLLLVHKLRHVYKVAVIVLYAYCDMKSSFCSQILFWSL